MKKAKITINELEVMNHIRSLSKNHLGELATMPMLMSIPKKSDLFISIFKEHVTVESNSDLIVVYKLSDKFILDNSMNVYEQTFKNKNL